MTNKRKIELIDMMLEWFAIKANKNNIRGQDKYAPFGLCHMLCLLKIPYKEREEMENLFFSSTKRRYDTTKLKIKDMIYAGEWLFKPGVIQPRINYLNKLKKKPQ